MLLSQLSGGEHVEIDLAAIERDVEVVADAVFEDCTFTICDLTGVELRGCRLDGCTLVDCNLSLLRPVDTRFSATTFRTSRLTGIDWTLAHWPNLSVTDLVAFDRCQLDHSTFLGLRLPEVRFHRCSMIDVDLAECDLHGASFAGCDLTRAHFSASDLRGAHLEGATGYVIDARANQVRGATVSLPDAAQFLTQLGLEVVEPPIDDEA